MERMYRTYSTMRSTNPIVLLLVALGVLFFVFWFLKAVVFRIFYIAAPVLFIAALVLNYRVVLGYGKWLLDTLKNNLLMGVVATALSIVCYPFVAAFLAFRAYQLRGETFRSKRKKQGHYIKYSEVEEDFLDISEEKEKQEEIKKQYGDLA